MKLTPAAATSTSTSPGPGDTAGRSSTTRTSRPPWRVTTRAGPVSSVASLMLASVCRGPPPAIRGPPRSARGRHPVAPLDASDVLEHPAVGLDDLGRPDVVDVARHQRRIDA